MPAVDSLARMLARPIAHRGLHGCGGTGPLENTLGAARAAIEAGYGIECAVRFARCGTPVVVHDATLARLAERPAAVADLDADALGTLPLRGGDRLPTLAALLATVAGRVALVVEIKPVLDPSRTDAVLALVERYAGPVALESFDLGVIRRCRRAPCPVGLVGPGDTIPEPAEVAACAFLSWDIRHIEGKPAHDALTSWTVRSADDASRAAAAGAQIVFEGWRP